MLKILLSTILGLSAFQSVASICQDNEFEVRSEARLQHLEHGAHLRFNERVEIPSFETEVLLGKDVRLYVSPSNTPRFINPERSYPIARSRDGRLRIGDAEIIYSSRAYLTTVGDLKQATSGLLDVCQQKIAERELWGQLR